MSPDPRLAREAEAFTRYLVGGLPAAAVVAHYVAAHTRRPELVRGTRFDRWLVALGRQHPAAAFLVDAFARVFTPQALVRVKLVLLLAILEASGSHHARIDTGWGPWPVAVAVLTGRGLLFVAAVVIGALVLLPLRLAAAIGGEGS